MKMTYKFSIWIIIILFFITLGYLYLIHYKYLEVENLINQDPKNSLKYFQLFYKDVIWFAVQPIVIWICVALGFLQRLKKLEK